MTEGTRKVAIICLGLLIAFTLYFLPDSPQIWGTLMGLMSLVLGGGAVIKNTVKHILRIP